MLKKVKNLLLNAALAVALLAGAVAVAAGFAAVAGGKSWGTRIRT